MKDIEDSRLDAQIYNIIVITGILVLLMIIAGVVIIVDPYFHYHAPITGKQYKITNERYQNNGIVRNFNYNAVITGTSMTENFKTSEMDSLFGLNAIKVPYAGGSYNEINDNLLIALKSNPDIEIVILGIDTNASLIQDKDAPFHGIIDYGYQYPWYMIDRNPLNDVSYLFNKEIFFKAIQIGTSSGECTSFDEAYSWNNVTGKEKVISSYERSDCIIRDSRLLTDAEADMMLKNVKQNILETAQNYPDVSFYLFIPPYSICWWDSLSRQGMIDYYIEALQLECGMLLQCENIKLFAFWNNYEMICDLDNYTDIWHYSAEINSDILQWMAEMEESYILTEINYQNYWNEIKMFYSNYDYSSIFE